MYNNGISVSNFNIICIACDTCELNVDNFVEIYPELSFWNSILFGQYRGPVTPISKELMDQLTYDRHLQQFYDILL